MLMIGHQEKLNVLIFKYAILLAYRVFKTPCILSPINKMQYFFTFHAPGFGSPCPVFCGIAGETVGVFRLSVPSGVRVGVDKLPAGNVIGVGIFVQLRSTGAGLRNGRLSVL
jgi:hypothetical protein